MYLFHFIDFEIRNSPEVLNPEIISVRLVLIKLVPNELDWIYY